MKNKQNYKYIVLDDDGYNPFDTPFTELDEAEDYAHDEAQNNEGENKIIVYKLTPVSTFEYKGVVKSKP